MSVAVRQIGMALIVNTVSIMMGDFENAAILIKLFIRWHHQEALEDNEIYRGHLQNYINISNLNNHSIFGTPNKSALNTFTIQILHFQLMLFSIHFRLAKYFSISSF